MRARTTITTLLGAAALLLPAATAAAAPANDDLAGATTFSTSVAGSTAGATAQSYADSGLPGSGDKSVWYRWTAPNTGRATLKVTAAGFDSVIGAYHGASDVVKVTPHRTDADTGIADNDSAVSFDVKQGQTFEIAVDGTSPSEYGSFTLSAAVDTTPPAPANDDFADAQQISATKSEYQAAALGELRNATDELGEPSNRGQSGTHSVWYRWTAPSDGGAQVHAWCGSAALGSTAPVVAVYTGASLGTLQPVSYLDEHAELGCHWASVRFRVKAGVTYRIALDNASASSGDTSLHLVFDGTAPTTTFSGPATLGDTGTVQFGAEAGSTFQCRLDGGLPFACKPGYAVKQLASGQHTLMVRATDKYGNVETTWKSRVFVVDRTPPETTFTATPPATTTKRSDFSWSFKANEPGATFECALPNRPFEACTSPATSHSLFFPTGTFQMKVRAIDAAGNVETTPAVSAWTIVDDAPAPSGAPGAPVATAPAPATTSTSTSGAGRALVTTPQAPDAVRLLVGTRSIRRAALLRGGLRVRTQCRYSCITPVTLRAGKRVLGRAVATSRSWAAIRLTAAGRAYLARKRPASLVVRATIARQAVTIPVRVKR